MTIYWERCNICGANRPVFACTLHPDIQVDLQCCIACPTRKKCPRPVWTISGLYQAPTREPSSHLAQKAPVSEREKILRDLEMLLGKSTGKTPG